MKKIEIKHFIAIFSIFCLLGCEDSFLESNGLLASITGNYFNLAVTSLTFGDSEEGQSFKINSSTSWTIENSNEWITTDKISGQGDASVYVTVSDNPGKERIGTLVVKSAGGVSRTIEITQSSKDIIDIDNLPTTITNDKLPKFSCYGGTTIIEQQEQSSWQAEVTEGIDWIHLSQTFGSENTTLTVSVDEIATLEERTGCFEIKYANNKTHRFNVQQEGISFAVATDSYTFSSEGGKSEVIKIDCSKDFQISSNADWLTSSKNEGAFSLIATKNPTFVLREAIVTIHVSGTNITSNIRVMQEAQPNANNHEYVDLGLSVKWATCNIGASSPEDFGEYFAWGEVSPKSTYSWSNYKYCNGTGNTLTKYCTDPSYGTVDNKSVLEYIDDAARVNWGGSWRLPTLDEVKELWQNCECSTKKINGITGTEYTSKINNKSIFIPNSGLKEDRSIKYFSSDFYSWTSSTNSNAAYYFCNIKGYILFDYPNHYRYYGCTIRPVCK